MFSEETSNEQICDHAQFWSRLGLGYMCVEPTQHPAIKQCIKFSIFEFSIFKLKLL